MKKPKKHVFITIIGIWTDQQLKKLICAIDVPKHRVVVVRDLLGNAIQVVVWIHENRIDDLQADLAKLDFPATILVSDIPAGTVGIDGTEEGLAALVALGFTEFVSPSAPAITYNPDETVTYTPTNTQSRVDYQKDNAIPVGTELVFETRCAITGTDQCMINLIMANGTYSADFAICQLLNWGQIVQDEVTGEMTYQSHVNPDGQFHVYKWVQNVSGLVSVYKDGLLQGTAQLVPGSGVNYARLILIVSGNSSLTIDYARWTTPE